MTSQFSLCSHYLDVAESLHHPRCLWKGGCSGQQMVVIEVKLPCPPSCVGWLSKERFIVPLPLIDVAVVATRKNPAGRQLGLCEAEYVRF